MAPNLLYWGRARPTPDRAMDLGPGEAVQGSLGQRTAILLMAAAFLADWVSKSWALNILGSDSMPLGPLSLEVARNEAFILSAGAGAVSPTTVLIVRLLGLLLLLLMLSRVDELSRRSVIGLALVVAGGLGNAADLIFRDGAVVDFISTGPVTLSLFGTSVQAAFVFNAADVWVFAGVFLLWPLFRQLGLRTRERLAGIERRVRRAIAPVA